MAQLEVVSKSVFGITIVYVGLARVSNVNVDPNGSKFAAKVLVIADVLMQSPLTITLIVIAVNYKVAVPWFTAVRVKV